MLLTALILVAAQSVFADDKKLEVINFIRNHFEKVTPEASRYSRVTTYGETLAECALPGSSISQERSLFKEAVAAGLLKSPTSEVLSLGHNLIVHEPTTGQEYLKLLHETEDIQDRNIARALAVATLASGEPGEKSAVLELSSKNEDRREFWARYLERNAIYASSSRPIQNQIAKETNPKIKGALIRALATIGNPDSLAPVKGLAEQSADDEVQAAAIFASAELAGFDGIADIAKIKTVGEKSAQEQLEALAWLKQETSSDSKHGREVSSDLDFVSRFADLKTSPVIRWLNENKLLNDAALQNPQKLTAEKKKELLQLLIDSKGFGLEAVKGALFRSLSKEDEPLLLKIRSVSYYSPNPLSEGRQRTIGIMICHLRQQ